MIDGISLDAGAMRAAFPDPALVAGYTDGTYAWSAADWNLFPHAVHVTITVLGGGAAADVVDCETGDVTPAGAAAWVRARKAAGYARPTIYCNRDTLPAVRQATGSLILGKDYDVWCADYTDEPHQVTAPGSPAAACAVTQYRSEANWDLSAVYDSGWPHRTAAKPPAPPADPVYGPPLDLKARPGHTSVALSWKRPTAVAGLPGASDFTVFIYKGTTCNTSTIVSGYPRSAGDVTSWQGGGLEENTEYTAHVTASGPAGLHEKPYTYGSATFTTGS